MSCGCAPRLAPPPAVPLACQQQAEEAVQADRIAFLPMTTCGNFLPPSCACFPPPCAGAPPVCAPPPLPLPNSNLLVPSVCGPCAQARAGASCGRYNYGTSCGGGSLGPFPEAEYRCKVDKTKCCAAAMCGPCALPCQAPCCAPCAAPCTIPCSNAKTCGFTEIGYVYSTDAYPVTTYLTKSCARCATDPFLKNQFAECTGCRAEAVPIDRADDGTTHSYLPQPSSMTLEDKFHNQRRESAFERPTTFSNNSIGLSPFSNVVGGPIPPCGTTNSSGFGWNHGILHGGGCKCRECCQDPFYHPRTTITVPTVSRYYTLYARRTEDCARLQFAVAPAGVCDPVLTILPPDPRRPPGCCYYANGCGINDINRGIVELRSGDQIYLTALGTPGPFFVHLWADSSGLAGVLRQSNSVFRGWGPVRRNPDEVRRFTPNSGLRNFSGTPSAGGLLRPW